MNQTVLNDNARMVANRLRKNLKRLAGWRRQQDIHCYRLYDADIPEYAVAVDLYQGERLWVHVQEYAAPKEIAEAKTRQRLDDALAAVREVLPVTNEDLFVKVRRQQKGKEQYTKLATTGHFHQVTEDGLSLWVNFEDYLDTGLFLDHRVTRAMVRKEAADKDFLNLFAYTGSATVHAAAGGAASTTTVDMSHTYLDWAQRNMADNGFSGQAHRFVQTDCIDWLRPAAAQPQRYDLIFVDPPSFSSSKRMQGTFDVQRDHVALIKASLRLLRPDGLLIFSNNRRRFKMDRDALPGADIDDISHATLPKDFERNPRIHNCWRIRHRHSRN